MNKKIVGVLGVMLLAAALLAVPVKSNAEMYVEAYLGGGNSANSSNSMKASIVGLPGVGVTPNFPGTFDPAVLGGLKVGTWFVPTGFLGYSYPDWMKYLGFYLDFGYQRLNMAKRGGSARISVLPNNSFGYQFYSEGTAATLAFMFAARYGFLPDSEVPFGRLQPYVAVGPAILFSTQQPTFIFNRINGTPAGPAGFDGGSQGSADIALAVEAGLRYMALKNVSIEISFKYRYASPSYSYTMHNCVAPAFPLSVKLEPTYNLFSGQVGVAYHF